MLHNLKNSKPIDYTFLMYQSALNDWYLNPNSKNHGTQVGFFNYFPIRHCVSFSLDYMPELFMIYTKKIQFSCGPFFNLRWSDEFRYQALILACFERSAKSDWPVLKNHFTSCRIRSLEELKHVLSTETLIYISKWHRVTPVGYFIGDNWPDATLQRYIDNNSFWMVHERNPNLKLI